MHAILFERNFICQNDAIGESHRGALGLNISVSFIQTNNPAYDCNFNVLSNYSFIIKSLYFGEFL